MLAKILSNTYAKLGIAAIIIVAVGFAYFQVRGLYLEALDNSRQIGYNTATIEKQEEMLKQRAELDLLRESQIVINSIEKKKLQDELASLRAQRREIEKRLYRDNDLDILLQARPEWILKLVQEGTNDRLQEIEEITQ